MTRAALRDLARRRLEEAGIKFKGAGDPFPLADRLLRVPQKEWPQPNDARSKAACAVATLIQTLQADPRLEGMPVIADVSRAYFQLASVAWDVGPLRRRAGTPAA